MKAIELLKEYDVNPKDFMVVLVDNANIHVLMNDDEIPADNRLITFVPLSKPSLNKENKE